MFARPVLLVECSQALSRSLCTDNVTLNGREWLLKLMTQEQAHHSRALDSFVVFALGITFILRYAHFLTRTISLRLLDHV